MQCIFVHTKLHFKPQKQQNRNSILPGPPTTVHWWAHWELPADRDFPQKNIKYKSRLQVLKARLLYRGSPVSAVSISVVLELKKYKISRKFEKKKKNFRNFSGLMLKTPVLIRKIRRIFVFKKPSLIRNQQKLYLC